MGDRASLRRAGLEIVGRRLSLVDPVDGVEEDEGVVQHQRNRCYWLPDEGHVADGKCWGVRRADCQPAATGLQDINAADGHTSKAYMSEREDQDQASQRGPLCGCGELGRRHDAAEPVIAERASAMVGRHEQWAGDKSDQ